MSVAIWPVNSDAAYELKCFEIDSLKQGFELDADDAIGEKVEPLFF